MAINRSEVESMAAPDELVTGPRLGLSSGTLFPDVRTEETPAVAAALGLVDIELMLQTVGEHEPALIAQIAANCRATGCRIHAIHTWQSLHPLFDPYPRRVEEGKALFARVIEATAELGARVIVWHGAKEPEVRTPEGWDRFLAVTAELAAACHSAGVILALENVSWCALATVRRVAAFAAKLPELGAAGSIGFVFDPFQAAEAGANPFMMLAAMGRHLVDVHLSDWREDDPASRHLPPGEGELPWPALLRAIANAGYGGPLMIEAAIGNDPAKIAVVRDRLAPLLLSVTPANDELRCLGTPPPGVLEGIALFNQREFYECHEVIEHEWHAELGEIRRLYQGILQIGVGFHHLRNRNYRGAVLLLRDGIAKTAPYAPHCLGIDTGRLVGESQACLARIEELGPDRLAEFDEAMIPVITMIA